MDHNFLNDLMGMTDDRAEALKVLESRAPWDVVAAQDLELLKNYRLPEERMAAWINMGEAAFVGKSEEDKDETQRQKDEEERLRQEEYDRQQRERQAEIDRIEALRQQKASRIPGILQALGYNQVSQPERYWRGTEYTGTNPDGKQINMNLGYDRTGRRDVFHVRVGVFPRPKEESVYLQAEQPSIAISPEKSDESIVREIQRRFIPAFDQFWAAAKAHSEKEDKYYSDTMNALQLIKGKKLDDYEIRRKELSVHSNNYTVSATVKASADRVSMEISGLTPEQAKKIKQIMLGKKNPMEEMVESEDELYLDDVSVEQAKEILDVIDAAPVTEAFGLGGKSEEDKEATQAQREAEREAARKREEELRKAREIRQEKERKLKVKGEKNMKMFPRFLPRMLRKAGMRPEKGGWRSEYIGKHRNGLQVEIGIRNWNNRIDLKSYFRLPSENDRRTAGFWLGDEHVKAPEGRINAGYDLKVIEDKFLNEYMPRCLEFVKKGIEYNKQEAEKASQESQLLASVKGAKLSPTEADDERLKFKGTGLEGRVTINDLASKTIDIEVDRVPAEVAQKIYAFLKGIKRNVQESTEHIVLDALTVEQAQEVIGMLGAEFVEPVGEALSGKSEEDKAETYKKVVKQATINNQKRAKKFNDFVKSAKKYCKVDLTSPYQTYIYNEMQNPEGLNEWEFCNAAENHLTAAGWYVYNSDSRFEVYDAGVIEASEDAGTEIEVNKNNPYSLEMEPEDVDSEIAMWFEDWDDEEDDEIEEALSGKSIEDKEATAEEQANMTDDEKIVKRAVAYGYSGLFALIPRNHLENAKKQLAYSKKIKDKFGIIVVNQLIRNRMAYDKAAQELGINLDETTGTTLDEAIFKGKSALDKQATAANRSPDEQARRAEVKGWMRAAMKEGPGADVETPYDMGRFSASRTLTYLGKYKGQPRFEYNYDGHTFDLLDEYNTLMLLLGEGYEELAEKEYDEDEAERVGEDYNPGFDIPPRQ